MDETNTTERGWIAITTLTSNILEADRNLEQLKDEYNVISWSDCVDKPDIYLDKIQVIITSPLDCLILSEDQLRNMTNLRAVSNISVGVDHLDLPLLRKFGVKIGCSLGTTADTTADFGFGLLIAVGRRIPEMMQSARGYEEGARFDINKTQRCTGRDIHEATLGIIGMGQIGFEVAKRAKGFRMKVLYHNRNRREDEKVVKATYCPTLEALLPEVDFLMLTAPLSETTKNMMRKERFEMMKPTSVIINVGRGPLINTSDLVEALQSGIIAGAALDTTYPEPLPDHHPLLHMPNVIVTPHGGMFTTEGLGRLCGKAVANARAALEGRQLPGLVE